MISEKFNDATISFSGRKEYDLERKVRKLEQEMLNLDNRLKNEKLLLKGNRDEDNKMNLGDTTSNWLIENKGGPNKMEGCLGSLRMAMGDAPDLGQSLPVKEHSKENKFQVEPTLFFTWQCSHHDFHSNSAQKSVYSVMDWLLQQNYMTTLDFKKQLSAFLAANSYHSLPLYPRTAMKRTKQELTFDTRELINSLRKKLRRVEAICTEEYLNSVLTSETPQEKIHLFERKISQLNEQEVIDDDIVFDIFKEAGEEYNCKPMDLKEINREVNNLEGMIKSFNTVDLSITKPNFVQ